MAKSAVSWDMDADPSKVLAAQKKVIAGQEETIRALQRSGRESKKGADEAEKDYQRTATAAKSIGLALVGGFGVKAALDKVIGLGKEFRETLLESARAARNVGDEMWTLSAMADPGKGAALVMRATQMAAPFGVLDRTGVYNVFQALVSQYGGDVEKGAAAAREVYRLTAAKGVTLQEALTAVSGGIGVGLPPDLAARLPLAAGKASAKSVRELIKIGPAALEYITVKGGPAEMWGVGAALAGIIDPERLRVFTERLGSALTTRAGKWGKRVGALPGAEEMDIWKMLGGLEAAGLATGPALEAAGLGEKRERQAIVALLRDLGAARQTAAAVRGYAAQEDLFYQAVQGAEKDFPALQRARWGDVLTAQVLGEAVTPTTAAGVRTSAEADRLVRRRQARGAAFHLYGLGRYALFEPPEKPEIGRWKYWTRGFLYEDRAATVAPLPDGGYATAPDVFAAARMIERAETDELPAVFKEIRDTLQRIEDIHHQGSLRPEGPGQ